MAHRGEMREIPLSRAKSNDLLTVDEVANLCGMTHGRVCQLLRSGAMRGQKLRTLWQVARKEAEKFIERPTTAGRPRVSESA